jgi:predicted Zn-dependent protease
MRPSAIALLCLLCLPAAVARPKAADSPILTAMQDELKRSMSDLRLPDQPAPYYISYGVDEVREWSFDARFGATVANESRRSRVLVVEVRVGDYGFDSSHFVTSNRSTNASGTVSAPLDDDYDAMRRNLWLATDAAYKRALLVFARKKAAFQNRSTTDVLPDLSKETPVESVLPLPGDQREPTEWADRVRDLSAVFASSPEIQNSDVSAGQSVGVQYFLNSEGFKEIEPLSSAWLRVNADTQTADGAALRDSFNLAETRLADMPAAPELVARTRALAARLTAARAASIGEEYTGPVLVEGDASSQLIAQAFLPLMLARRPSDVEGPGRGGAPPQSTPFLTRIGLRVLPDAFSVSDTPSLKTYEGRPVPGAFTVDDEGVRAKDVSLVENGKLLTLLTSRAPQRKLLQSNGHGRSGSAQAGVFQMKSAQAVPASELKKKYIELLKDQDKTFGYIVRSIGGGTAPTMADVVRVSLDGAEVPVRGLRFAAITAPTFRNILDASTERPLYNYMTASGDTVSVIAPSMIFEELEIQQTKDIVQKPPIVPSPLVR